MASALSPRATASAIAWSAANRAAPTVHGTSTLYPNWLSSPSLTAATKSPAAPWSWPSASGRSGGVRANSSRAASTSVSTSSSLAVARFCRGLPAISCRIEPATRPSSSYGPRTLTRKLPVVVFPARSVAVQSTWFVPIGKVLPEAGEQLMFGCGSKSSVADTDPAYLTTLPNHRAADTEIGPGSVSVGGVSWTRGDQLG